MKTKISTSLCLLAALLAGVLVSNVTAADKKKAVKVQATGYTDTPFLPRGKWRMHDDARPRPKVVTSGEKVGDAPSDALVLFDEAGEVQKKAYVTVSHNGVLTQHRQVYLGSTGHKSVAEYKKHPAKMSFKLQDHNNPVRYRNIWVRELHFSSND